MEEKYYFISYRIEFPDSPPKYYNDVINMSPIEYILYWNEIGGDYSQRTILFAQEISEKEFKEYEDKI